MTPRHLLSFFGEARGLSGEHLEQRMSEVTEQCELRQFLEKPIGKLSKGLRQRVGLAQALLHDPGVLIMDEPTAGLDPNQIRQFRSLVGQLRRSKTLLISTHILQEVDAIAERVLVVHDGRLAFDGAPDELRENGSLEEPFYRLTHP
jgi:ABC-2 type transport system ATP-binding protein